MYIIIYSLCLIFLVENNHVAEIFVPSSRNSLLSIKKFLLKFLVNRQVWPCFEDLVIKEIIVKLKLNLDAWFYTYCSFNFEFVCT